MMLPILAFVFGSLIIAAAAIAFMPGRAVAIERRLEELTSAREDGPENRRTYQALMGLVKRVGERAPKNVKELSSLRQRLMQARQHRAAAPIPLDQIILPGRLREIQRHAHDVADQLLERRLVARRGQRHAMNVRADIEIWIGLPARRAQR